MRAIRQGIVTALLGGVVFTAALGVAQAGDLAPKVPIDKSKGSCVLPGDEMRKQHMNILKHRRDDTMFNGVRGGKRSLEACLTCHAVKDEKTGKPVTIKSPKHFCRVCHDYAAVKVDCWTCHKSVPEQAGNQAMLKEGKTDKASMFALLRGFVQGGAND